MADKRHERRTISDEDKRHLVEKLLRRELTVQQVVDDRRIHPYQVHAWVGQMVLGDGIGRTYRISPDGTRVEGTHPAYEPNRSKEPLTTLIYQKITGSTDSPDDPMRAIGEWYVREVFLRQTQGSGGKQPPGEK